MADIVEHTSHLEVASTKLDGSSFASHNPIKDIIPTHVCHHAKHTNAKTITANARHELNKDMANALKIKTTQFFNHRDTEISWLAKKFHNSELNMKQLLTNQSNYQNMHAPLLHNALVHAKGLEMNEDCGQGDRLMLAEIQHLVNNNASMNNLSKSQKQEYINDLQAHRDTKKSGAHASNAVAAMDCRGTVARISEELTDLSECTGMCTLAFFTHTHIHDSMLLAWADSDDAIAFISEVLKLDPMEFLVWFEQWACAHTKGIGVQENLRTVRTDCTCLIAKGLHKILNIKNVSMSYMKYDCNIISKYKVELLGWPTSVKFANPLEIGTIGEI
ncbi:hypothetical protein L208DRAFT_1478308 [Tricholoma matsutake]|nr:hypothetical protein L208DRAFT_1478308 [Tricholoma matsutake 945]